MMLHNMHGRFFMRTLSDADMALLASTGSRSPRFAVAEVYEPTHGAHVALCGPGTGYPDWESRDIHLMLAIGDWKPGNPVFDRTLALRRYEGVLRQGKGGERHSIRVMRLGSPAEVAEMAKAELDRREGERESWESAAA